MVYVASSWRNRYQPKVVGTLRGCALRVYDFRNPAPCNAGFSWSEIDPQWETWTPDQYRKALDHPVARAGHRLDMDALLSCRAALLVLPSGRSASWEFGFAMGQGKGAAVFMPEPCEPELMYRGSKILVSWDELAAWGHALAEARDG